MRATATSAVEVLLGVTPVDLKVGTEAQVGIYRLACSKQLRPKPEWYRHAHMSCKMKKELPYPTICRQHSTKKCVQKPFTFMFPDRRFLGRWVSTWQKWETNIGPVHRWVQDRHWGQSVWSSLSSPLGNAPWYFRQKCMPSRYVQHRI